MDFEIKITITNEFPSLPIQSELIKLDRFIKEKIKDREYGTSVKKYFWGFELLRFKGGFFQFFKDDIESWKHSKKWLVTNSRFDWDEINSLDENARNTTFKKALVNSIDRIGRMKRKPKDFDYQKFKIDLITILELS